MGGCRTSYNVAAAVTRFLGTDDGHDIDDAPGFGLWLRLFQWLAHVLLESSIHPFELFVVPAASSAIRPFALVSVAWATMRTSAA